MVTGMRPPGSDTPMSTSASALPNSWPGSHAYTTAATLSAQGRATWQPAFTTTIVLGFEAATRSTSSSWRPGSVTDLRSRPSDSHVSSVPTTTMATSAEAAAATAGSLALASAGGWQP